MPASKSRHPHHSRQAHSTTHITTKHTAAPKTSRVVKIAMIIFSLFGLVLGYFMSTDNWVTLIISPVVGAVVGYFFGHQIEKSWRSK